MAKIGLMDWWFSRVTYIIQLSFVWLIYGYLLLLGVIVIMFGNSIKMTIATFVIGLGFSCLFGWFWYDIKELLAGLEKILYGVDPRKEFKPKK